MYKNLFHEEKAFQRETFLERMQKYGFKNMGRMELFLWDLELFLQIQKILGDRIVLKGGAATQFYLPIEAQRTSVDIDMLFFGTEEEINVTLDEITSLLSDGDGLFEFKKYIPKKPKTALPLNTYHVNIPSVLSAEERRTDKDEIPHQELKIEFIMQSEELEFEKKTGENIFAVNSKCEYQILPLNTLFADKLTTLGCETIGVQNSRMDEQVKQFYDIMMLIRYCLSNLDSAVVHEKYLKRAKEEWMDRSVDECNMDTVIADVRKQLYRYEMADSGEDAELKKCINDFNSLYLNSKVDYSPQSVACGASLIKLLYELILSGKGWGQLFKAFEIERKLLFEQYTGKEKGQKIKKAREALVEEFAGYAAMPSPVLKGKNLKRVFWAIVNIDNLDEIEKVVDSLLQMR